MRSALFLQSDIENPYALYEIMLAQNPVYWDEPNQLWAIYSYADCETILHNFTAQIPLINQNNKDGLNEYALLITKHLVRLSNNTDHIIARELAMLLFQNIKKIPLNEIIEKLLHADNSSVEKDFVSSVCKQLPIMAIAKSFDFSDEETNFIAEKIASFTKIMAAVKTAEQVKEINTIATQLYCITEKHFLSSGTHLYNIETIKEKYKIDTGEILAGCVSNCIGLFIQGYDACRGVLSNALLQLLHSNDTMKASISNRSFIEKSVIETLRFDPPVQNTRRIAAENILIGNKEIKKGQTILVVLAAANRDPQKFSQPGKYDIDRSNNNEHLTFGAGHHQCVAKHFSITLATETLSYLFERYKKIELSGKQIEYEPLINVRLPKEILISIY